MLNEERRREILELLRNDSRVLVRDLSKRFRTSLITIRKDLEYLHHQGLLERTHGGALPIRTGALQDQTLREKELLHRQEKMRIAAAALRMIRPGQVIILDSGTTTTAIARGCRHLRSLTVITNATNIAAELADSNVEVILTGGSLRKSAFSLVGPLAEESLRKLSADLLFLAVDGFDVKGAVMGGDGGVDSSERGDLASFKTYRNILQRLSRPISFGQLASFECG